MTNIDSVLKSRDIILLSKVHIVKAMVFPLVMYQCESWSLKKTQQCWRIDAVELWCWRRLLRVPWTARRSNQSILKGDQSWVFIGRTDAKDETLILWPSDANSWLNGKDPDAGKDWGQKEKGITEDEMVGWHHWLNGHGSEPTRGDSEGQGGQACWHSWGRQESDTNEDWTTEQPHPYFLQQPTFVDHTSIHYSDTPKPWESSWIPFHFLPPQIQSPSHQSFTSSSQVPQSLT